MRYIELVEKRRNAAQNPKTNFIEELSKYKGQDDVFVSFTHDVGVKSHTKSVGANTTKPGESIHTGGLRASGKSHNIRGNKLGINPMSSYDTPTGIYTYPIDYVLKRNGSVEFAGMAPYIQVVRIKPGAKILFLHKITDNDVEKLIDQLGHSSMRKTAMVSTPGGRWWNVLYSDVESELNDLEHDTLGIEPDEYEYDTHEEYEEALSDYEHNAQHSKLPSLGNLAARTLRKLGYDGVVDYDPSTGLGQGIVHNNEETQGVFFKKSAIEHLETIHNHGSRREPMTDNQIWTNKPHIFINLMKKGKLTDDQVMDYLRYNRFMVSSSHQDDGKSLVEEIWQALPDHIKKYITKDPEKAAGDSISHFFYQAPDFSSVSQIKILKKEARLLVLLRNVKPATYEWIVHESGEVGKSIQPYQLPEKYSTAMYMERPELFRSFNGSILKINPKVLLNLLKVDSGLFKDKVANTWEFTKVDDRVSLAYFKLIKKVGNYHYPYYVRDLERRNFPESKIELAASLLSNKQRDELLNSAPNSLVAGIIRKKYPETD